MIGNRRTRLDVNKLEGMSKIRSYYLTSIKNELSYYGKELSVEELREVASISTVGEIISLDNEDDTDSLLLEEEDEIQIHTNLVVEDIIDLNQPIFENMENRNESNNESNEENEETRNMDFNPIDIVDQILGMN